MRTVGLVLVLATALVPVASALDVDASLSRVLVVHVTRDEPGTYAVEADARARVEWVDADGNGTLLDLAADAPVPLSLAPGRHAFTVTHATRDGWLLVVPEDAQEPGAAFAFGRARPAALWLTDHGWSVLAGFGLVTGVALVGRVLRQKA